LGAALSEQIEGRHLLYFGNPSRPVARGPGKDAY
jgi:hypothetical protein